MRAMNHRAHAEISVIILALSAVVGCGDASTPDPVGPSASVAFSEGSLAAEFAGCWQVEWNVPATPAPPECTPPACAFPSRIELLLEPAVEPAVGEIVRRVLEVERDAGRETGYERNAAKAIGWTSDGQQSLEGHWKEQTTDEATEKGVIEVKLQSGRHRSAWMRDLTLLDGRLSGWMVAGDDTSGTEGGILGRRCPVD